MKSILHVGIEAPTYSSRGMGRAFGELFEDYNFLDFQKIRFNAGLDGLRQRVIGKTMMCQPDIVFLHLQTPESIDVETAKELTKHSFVVNYTFDIRNDIEWYKELAPHIGLTLFGDMESVVKLKKQGIKNVEYLQSSADFSLYRKLDRYPIGPDGLAQEPDYDIVFIGGNYTLANVGYPFAEERQELVGFMHKAYGDRFRVFGMGWESLNIATKMVHASDEIIAYSTAKIAITHNHYHRAGYTSDRLFRAIGCGIMTISQHYAGIEEEFNSNVLSWDTFSNLKKICDFYLDRNNEDLRIKRAAENSGLIRNTCNWTSRFKQMLTLINKYYGRQKARETV